MHGVLLDTSADGTQWGAIAVGLLTLIYIAFVRPLRKGKKKDPLARKPVDTALAQQRAMERDMTTLLVEYEQMMRTMTGQLETRVAKLEMLLRDADERIASLRSAAVGGSTESNSLPLTPLPETAPVARAGSTVLSMKEEPEPPRHAEVYALADQGLSYRQIAQRLDRPYGEIELIIALRPKVPLADKEVSIEVDETLPMADGAAQGSSHSQSDEADDMGGSESPGSVCVDEPVAEDVRREGELALAGATANAGSYGQQHSQGRRRKKRR